MKDMSECVWAGVAISLLIMYTILHVCIARSTCSIHTCMYIISMNCYFLFEFKPIADCYSCFHTCVHREIAAAVVKSSQWPVALRRTYTDRGHETTPFRELIRKMPGRCSV